MPLPILQAAQLAANAYAMGCLPTSATPGTQGMIPSSAISCDVNTIAWIMVPRHESDSALGVVKPLLNPYVSEPV